MTTQETKDSEDITYGVRGSSDERRERREWGPWALDDPGSAYVPNWNRPES